MSGQLREISHDLLFVQSEMETCMRSLKTVSRQAVRAYCSHLAGAHVYI